jgi:hypothetical protein
MARGTDPADGPAAQEVRAVLDEEMLRLPERFRLPVVLCYLQGKSNTEAAAELGCPKGTVDSRLSEARRRLRGRLLRRGLAPAAGAALEHVLAGTADAGELPGSVVRPVVQAAAVFVTNRTVAAGAVSASAAALAQEVLHTMFLTRLKWIAVTLLALGLCGSGAGVATYEAVAGGQPPTPAAENKAPQAKSPAPDKAEPSHTSYTSETRHAAPSTAQQVRLLLRQPAGIDRPIENVPLKDVLELLSDKFKVTIRLDLEALRRHTQQPFQIYDQPVRLPVVRGLTVGEVLRDVLAQVRLEGGIPVTFLVKGSQIAIVPPYVVPFTRTLGGKLAEQPVLNPDVLEDQIQGDVVTVEYQGVPLADALRELADSTGTNIVLDPRLKESGNTPVAATMQNVRLYTALKVLADMAELQPVVIGNVYYVTDRGNAERLEVKEWPQPEPAEPVNPPARPSPPAAPKKNS